MKSKLEKYLGSRRPEMDVEDPDDQIIWEGIRSGLHDAKQVTNRRLTWIRMRNIAAVAILVLCLGYVGYDLVSDRSGKMYDLSGIDRELGTREAEYQTLVAYKLEEAMPANDVDNLIIKELFEEIRRLDTIYEITMKDLMEIGYNELAINTIFDTYEKKIYLLELIILENNKIKYHETEQSVFL